MGTVEQRVYEEEEDEEPNKKGQSEEEIGNEDHKKSITLVEGFCRFYVFG